MDAKKELDHVKSCSENYHNAFREGFFLGMLCGLQKTSFHESGLCWVYNGRIKRLFNEVFDELKKEHDYQIGRISE